VDHEGTPPPDEIRLAKSKLISDFPSGNLKQILLQFEPLTMDQKVHVIGRLLAIRYVASSDRAVAQAATKLLEAGGARSFEDHRARMAAISTHAARLLALLEEEPFFPAILHDVEKEGVPDDDKKLRAVIIHSPPHLGDHFFDELIRLFVWADILQERPNVLRRMRSALAGDYGGRKSFERSHVWEPIFDLWLACGKRLGASRSGKVHEVLKIMHKSLDLDDPNPETVYRAIREFKKERGSQH
jgi:hypothetical protein